MNAINFAWSTLEEATARLIVMIDGSDLVSLAEAAERESASRDGQPRLAGHYAGLGRRLPRLEDYLLGRDHSSAYEHEDGARQILVCYGCREAACWRLVVRIDALSKTVRWSGFALPQRDEWDHSTLGPFEFSRKQYEAALRSVTQASS